MHDLEKFLNISREDFESTLQSLSEEAMRAMHDLEKFPHFTLEDFESFSVESSWGGNAGNAGLRKISKYP